VLYASGSRLGAFVEVLSRFRPDRALVRELAEVEGDGAPPGELDASWLASRCMGVARLHGEFVDIGHERSIAHVRAALAERAADYGIDALDAPALRLSAPRRFAQEISRYVYEQSTAQGERRFAGIAYRSRLGEEFDVHAIFEPAGGPPPLVEAAAPQPLAADDPDLHRALELLGVRLVG